MSMLKAFHGKQEIKDLYVARVQAHYLADEIVKGTYWENGKGCGVGCTVHSSNHMAYEEELGIPIQLAYLEDGIFESLPNGHARDFPLRFISAPRVGADLSFVVNHFLIWLLTDSVHGVIRFARNESERRAILNVSNLHRQVIEGNPPSAAARTAASDAAADAS